MAVVFPPRFLMTIFFPDERIPSNYNNVFQGLNSKGRFTGFLVSNDLVLTVKHALPGRNTSFQTSEGRISATNVFSDPYRDYALFQLDRSVSITPFTLDKPQATLLPLGTQLIGFHADYPGQTSSFKQNTTIEGFSELYYKHDAFRGSSGGPILDFRGFVIGVNYAESASGNYNIAESVTQDMLDDVAYYDSLQNGSSYNFVLDEHDFDVPQIARFLNTDNHSHLYTTDEEVIRDLANDDRFVQETSNIMDNGEGDVYEFYNTHTNSYFYTRSVQERWNIERNLDHFEINSYGQGHVFGVDDNTMHRLYNPENGRHFYTPSDFEAQYVIDNLGFQSEGFL